MNEVERGQVGTPALTKEAKAFNSIDTNSVVQGMKTAAYIDRQILEAERAQLETKENLIDEETLVPTGAEIREDYEKGEYR